MTTEEIREAFRQGRFRVTLHAQTEAAKDGIEAGDYRYVGTHGVEVERRDEDCRVLLSAQLEAGYAVHVVVEYGHQDVLWVVTAYLPDSSVWIMPKATRRKPRR